MIEKIAEFIRNWQNKNDLEFTPIPIDNHSALIFNNGNRIYKFMFSNKHKRDNCKSEIPKEYLSHYDCMIEQEDGFTFYKFNLEGD